MLPLVECLLKSLASLLFFHVHVENQTRSEQFVLSNFVPLETLSFLGEKLLLLDQFPQLSIITFKTFDVLFKALLGLLHLLNKEQKNLPLAFDCVGILTFKSYFMFGTSIRKMIWLCSPGSICLISLVFTCRNFSFGQYTR